MRSRSRRGARAGGKRTRDAALHEDAFAKLLGTRLRRTEDELVMVLKDLSGDKQQKKLAELQAFRQKLFQEWSF